MLCVMTDGVRKPESRVTKIFWKTMGYVVVGAMVVTFLLGFIALGMTLLGA